MLEGDATVDLDTGEVIDQRPGVVAFFACGHESTWTIREAILKGLPHRDLLRAGRPVGSRLRLFHLFFFFFFFF